MKRCPVCRRDYTDETLNFCLDDGTALLDGPASGSEAGTAILSGDSNSFDSEKTRVIGDSGSSTTAIPRRRRVVFLTAAIVLVALVAGAWVGFRYLKNNKAGPSFQNSILTRVTTSGRAQEADISPDGKFVVYLDMEDDGDRGLWIKQTATGDTIPIVPPTKGNVLKGTTFSRDSNFVYYLFTDRTRRPSLYQVSSLGGVPRKIVDVCDSPVTLSPDGQQLAFVRFESHTKTGVITAKADGSNEKVLASLEGLEWFSTAGASWSPDGKTIAIAGGITADGVDNYRLLGVDTGDGSVRELTSRRWISAGRVVWMPDGESLILGAVERIAEGGSQIWEVEYPAGTATRITNDVTLRDDTSIGVTSDGRTMLTVTEQRLSRIESIPANGQVERLTKLSTADANIEGFLGLSTLPDGRVVFSSSEGGQTDIWIMNADGTGRRKLTSDVHWDGHFTVSPDGKFVVFKSNRPSGEAVPRLWRMNIDGTNLIQLAERVDSSPSVSPDGQWVLFSSWSGADSSQPLRRVSINGGEASVLTDYPVYEASYSPDGKWIGAYFSDENANRWRFGVLQADGGRPVRSFDFPSFQYEWVRWVNDGKNLSFIGAPPDPSNIWLQPVDGGEPRKLTDFKSDYIFRHEWSRDGKTLFLVRGRPSYDVVLQTAGP